MFGAFTACATCECVKLWINPRMDFFVPLTTFEHKIFSLSFDFREIWDQFQYSGNQYPAPNYFSNSGHFTRDNSGEKFSRKKYKKRISSQKKKQKLENRLLFKFLPLYEGKQSGTMYLINIHGKEPNKKQHLNIYFQPRGIGIVFWLIWSCFNFKFSSTSWGTKMMGRKFFHSNIHSADTHREAKHFSSIFFATMRNESCHFLH